MLAVPYVSAEPVRLLELAEHARITAVRVDESTRVETFAAGQIADRLAARSIPRDDTPHGEYRRSFRARIETPTMKAISAVLDDAVSTGSKFYPAGGFLDWHTNSDFPGRRIYLIWNEGSGSFFRYKDPNTGVVHTVEDPVGWSFRTFVVATPPAPPLWHCIYAAQSRFAMGFRTYDGT